MRVLVTGGDGFIGSHLCERLSKIADVLSFDLPNDVRFSDQVNKVFEEFKPTHVVHLASLAGVDRVIHHPVETMETTLLGTYNVLNACEVWKSRYIGFSTSEVFGDVFRGKEDEVTRIGAVGEARWTYAVSKLAAEHLAHSFHKEFGLSACSIRPFNVFGPGQKGEGAVHTFIQAALKGDTLKIQGGDQIRSWCYIDDMVDGTMRCIEKNCIGTFNIGNPLNTCTIYSLAKMICDLTGAEMEIVGKKEVDVELRIPSIEKSREVLGFEPRVDLEEGLRRTVEWYKATGTEN